MLQGRSAELAIVDGVLADVVRGRPFVVTIAGDEGSGRTALLDEAVDRAAASGATVLAGRGRAGAASPAFSGLLGLLRPLADRFDDLAGVEAADVVRRALALRSTAGDDLGPVDVGVAVLRVVDGLAQTAPVVFAIDDADGIDPASSAALTFALAGLGRDAVGAFVTVSSSGAGSESPWAGVATRELLLGPLGARHLVAAIRGAVDCGEPAAARCAEWSGGNPLLAIELARSFTDEERNGSEPLPAVPRPGLRAVERMREQLDAVSEAARRAVVIVAAGATSVTLAAAALQALGEAPGGVDDAEDAGVVRIAGDDIQFAHSLLQPLAYHLVAAASRRAAHRAIATVLTEPRQAAARAWHLVESCAGPDEDAATALELVAADARRRGALADAAGALERAASLSPAAGAAAGRRRRAAEAWLDAFDFDATLRLVEPGSSDPDDAALALEALERRDGPVAALAEHPVDDVIRADLLLANGRRADASTVLDAVVDALADADRDPLAIVVSRALDSGSDLGPAPDPRASPRHRRAYRRWLAVAGDRRTPIGEPSTVDELVAAAATAAADPPAARSLLERALAMVPPTAIRVRHDLTRRLDVLAEAAAVAAPAPVATALAALTKAEQRVAEAVAVGLTNREVADQLFVSVKTVDFHLQAIYRKLTIRSRTELAVLLARSGVGAPTSGTAGMPQ